jgi:hypothetical protein
VLRLAVASSEKLLRVANAAVISSAEAGRYGNQPILFERQQP